ncbi:MAG: NAD-dependent epimerase/dehydratase [Planctomycetota bacterium]
MNVLLTGGYGCIGSWIAKNLLARGDRVWIYDLKEDPKRMRLIMPEAEIGKVAFVPGDVTDLPRLKDVFAAQKISHVVHLAGLQVPTCRADPILGAKVNVLGTLAVFEAIKALGDQVKRLVYTSSAAVFGPPEAYPAGKLRDDVQLKPTTHYGHFKCCNEGNAHIYFQDNGISSIGLRPWTVYGVGRDFGMTSEPTKAIKSLALGRRYRITYGGWQDLQLVDDVAKIIVRCLDAEYQGAKSYNIRGHVVDLPTFHKALVEVDPAAAQLITHGDKQIPIAFDLDDAALRKDLSPPAMTPLVDGIRQTLTLFKNLQSEGRLDTDDLPS